MKPFRTLAAIGAAGLGAKGTYHVYKGSKIKAASPDEIPGFITSNGIDPVKEIKNVNIKELDKPVEIINSLKAAKASKDKNAVNIFKSIEFGGNAYADVPAKGDKNRIYVSNKINKGALYHELGHLRKGTTIRELDKQPYYKKLRHSKGQIKEEEAAWEFAHRHVPKDPMHDKILNTYKKGRQYQLGTDAFLGAAGLGALGLLLKK